MQGVENNLPVEEEGLLDSKNDWTEIPTGYLEPKMDIVDMQQTELDEHADMLEVPDERNDPTRQSSGHSIEFAPKMCLRQDQSLPTSGKTILDVPGPLPNAQIKCPIPQDEPSVRTHSATSTELRLPVCMQKYDKMRQGEQLLPRGTCSLATSPVSTTNLNKGGPKDS
ncbi:hypothetical protein EDC04DRAFT_2910790 [Pisolithus marmoratus]|nr:hypothetical protein EDC04DRAFT_2910790 [Pisolithus marmoratus]